MNIRPVIYLLVVSASSMSLIPPETQDNPIQLDLDDSSIPVYQGHHRTGMCSVASFLRELVDTDHDIKWLEHDGRLIGSATSFPHISVTLEDHVNHSTQYWHN